MAQPLTNIDIITAVRSVRRIVSNMDSLGFPIAELLRDDEIAEEIPADIQIRMRALTADIHLMLQNIEKSKRYKQAVQNMHDSREK